MKSWTKFCRVAVLSMLCAAGGRVTKADVDTDYYLYWMVGERYVEDNMGTFQGAQLVAVLSDNTEVRAEASGWFYAQDGGTDPNVPAPVKKFAGGPLKADLSGVVSPSDSQTIAGFFVEFYNYNAATEKFEMIGYSGLSALNYEDVTGLQNAIADFRDDRNPHVATTYYSPSGYNVPEPSGGLLLLVGGAMLVLRRRRRG